MLYKLYIDTVIERTSPVLSLDKYDNKFLWQFLIPHRRFYFFESVLFLVLSIDIINLEILSIGSCQKNFELDDGLEEHTRASAHNDL